MNGINRRSQKVVCVMEIEILVGTLATLTRYLGPYPQVDETYTVADFLLAGFACGGGSERLPGIALVEVPSIRCAGTTGQLMGWPIEAFRPADERKTDISALTGAAREVDLFAPLREALEEFPL